MADPGGCPKKFYLWEKESKQKLRNLCLFNGQSGQTISPQPGIIDEARHASRTSDHQSVTTVECSVCGVALSDRDEQLHHYSTQWHTDNQLRQLEGRTVLSQREHRSSRTAVTKGSRAHSANSSSRSRSSSQERDSVDNSSTVHDDDTAATLPRLPRLFFQNKDTGHVMSIWRPLLQAKKTSAEDPATLCTSAQSLPDRLTVAVLMISGGYFAGAVYDGNTAVAHKTFHSYVTRQGQGFSQLAHDDSNKFAHSAGASLRRYNAQQYLEHIQGLLAQWTELLKSCDLVFAVGSKQLKNQILGSTPGIAGKTDPRLRSVPFITHRPSHDEVGRVHGALMEVMCYGTEDPFAPSKNENCDIQETENETNFNDDEIDQEELDHNAAQAKKNKRKKKKKVIEGDEYIPEEDILQHMQDEEDRKRKEQELTSLRSALLTASKLGQLELLRTLYDASKVTATQDIEGLDDLPPSVLVGLQHLESSALLQLQVGPHCRTPLHLATEAGHADVVTWLLSTGQVDLGLNDGNYRVPYSYCSNKAMRNVYKDFREQWPDAYDYRKSTIPAPVTAAERSALAEAKRVNRAAKREKQAAERVLQEQKQAEASRLVQEQQERLNFLQLSDREKRALAAERRFTTGTQLTQPGELLTVSGQVTSSSSGGIRCFRCAAAVLEKEAFHYSDNKFCSTACLAQHRKSCS